MKSIQITTPAKQDKYDISFHEDFKALGSELKTQIGNRKYILVTDKNVHEKTALIGHEFEVPENQKVVLLPGESEKKWLTIDKILTACFEAGLDRGSVLVAVGGGVVGDMTGFAASIFMRGIPFIQVPTTLLGMVDASIGGKTGIDCEYGKNLIGSIQQPEAVMVCDHFLETLPDLEIKNGIAEMVKHGVVASEKHFADLEALASQDWAQVRAKIFELAPASMNIKKTIVEADEKEAGKRKFLNFGHTFGHAIELCSSFEIPHGRAVAIGCVMAANYAAERELCDWDLVDRLENIFNKFEVDLTCDIPEEDIWKAMGTDKKKFGDTLTLILPKTIGEVDYYDVTL
ncbi:3-dehydroquinate synthase [bacterium]|nr:3-dehydroquinate synthase [bacterium]NCQ55015.1 3-dehydroquinate synthase [Candidatus Parcubacteria bacterium]NCS67059.1 3-dehydroquinate synthase [Candidatus Peregrinibacteria bacterium]NCS96005.1 3-dehydroquinate synthase [bacterium]